MIRFLIHSLDNQLCVALQPTHSHTHSLTHSLTHTHTHTHTRTRTLACLLTHSLPNSLNHTHPCSLAHSQTHSLFHSLTKVTHSVILQSLAYWILTQSLTHSLNCSIACALFQLPLKDEHWTFVHQPLTPQYKAIIINSCNTFCLILSFFIRPEDVCSQPVLSSSLSSSWSMWLSRRDFSLDTEEDGGLGVVLVSWFLLARTFHFLISVLAISPDPSSSLRNWFTVLPIPVALRFKCEFISLLNMFNKRGVSALSWSFRCFKHNAVALTVPINTRSLTTCR